MTNWTDREICEWIVDMCLRSGTTYYTAYIVAGLFIQGVRSRTNKVVE
jgi:hypothetical protein